VDDLGQCPKDDPGDSRAPFNEGVRGLGKELVPIQATTVRVCSYQSLPTGENAVTSGTPALAAADLERETNALALYPTPVGGGCVAFPKDVFVTFANASQRSSVIVALGCASGASNRVLVAHATTKWVNDIQDFTTTSLNAAAVFGAWRPMTIAGYRGALTSPPLALGPELSFDGKGGWTGSDGCNQLVGTYRFGARGAAMFSVAGKKRRCLQITPREPLQQAKRVEVVNGLLTFFDGSGAQLAQYALYSFFPPGE